MILHDKNLWDVLILDGPIGTELVEAGFASDSNLWTSRAALENPKLLKSIYRSYLDAGANILTTNTFRADSKSILQAGMSSKEGRKLIHSNIALTMDVVEEFLAEKESLSKSHLLAVAGSVGPISDCYSPQNTPSPRELEELHHERLEYMSEAGVDFILAETIGTAKEAMTLVSIAKRKIEIPIIVSFIPDESGERLLGGEPLLETATACVKAGAEAILVNCAYPIVLDAALDVLAELAEQGVILGAYGNSSQLKRNIFGGVEWENPMDGWAEQEKYSFFAEFAESWVKTKNVKIVGSCCGTNSNYLQAISNSLRNR